MLLLDKFQAAQLVSAKLGLSTLDVDDFGRCRFSITSPGGGGPPIVSVRGRGIKNGKEFNFEIRGRLWCDNDGMHFEHETNVNWE